MDHSCHQVSQTQTSRQIIPSKGDQAAGPKSRLGLLVAAHRAVAFFDPPANGAFTMVVRAIYDLISILILPGTIKRQARS